MFQQLFTFRDVVVEEEEEKPFPFPLPELLDELSNELLDELGGAGFS